MRLHRRGVLAAAFSLAAAPASAASAVDLLLVLAADASGSVDQRRFDLQKQGYAAALRNPRIMRSVAAGPAQAIAVAMTQWTGPTMQAVVLGWTRLQGPASFVACADAVAASDRQLFGGGTSISGAIDHAAALIAEAPFAADRRVIDVSGDGANNRGRNVAAARDAAVGEGITINGLPILSLEPNLDEHYRTEVIGGIGAFTIAVDSYDGFAEAILRKLMTEIAGDVRQLAG